MAGSQPGQLLRVLSGGLPGGLIAGNIGIEGQEPMGRPSEFAPATPYMAPRPAPFPEAPAKRPLCRRRRANGGRREQVEQVAGYSPYWEGVLDV